MNGMKVAIYDVKVNNVDEKAINVNSLLNWLQHKKLDYSMINLDPSNIEPDEGIMKYIAKANNDILAELEVTLLKAAGLYKEPEPEVIEEPEPEPEEPIEDKSQIEDPVVLEEEEVPKPKGKGKKFKDKVADIPEDEESGEITI